MTKSGSFCLNRASKASELPPPGPPARTEDRPGAAHLCAGCHDDQTPANLRKLAVFPQIIVNYLCGDA